MAPERFSLLLRIVMEDYVPGVAIVLQRGTTAKAERVGAAATSPETLIFDFDVFAQGALPDGRPRLLGPFVQGPPQARFVYLCVGQSAGQHGSQWNRRVKVPLGGISMDLIQTLAPGDRLEARIAGRGRDGSPACATVPLLPPGWRVCR
jgi:hypothetical protein